MSKHQISSNNNKYEEAEADTRPGSWQSDRPLSRTSDDRPVVINVGGIRFYVSWALLERLPQTRLGKLRRAKSTADILELCDKFNLDDNEYYFDRHPRNFGAVINFYRTGRLHLGEEGCPVAFRQDLDFWGIDELYLEPCCQQRYYQARELLGIDRIEKVEEPEYFRPGTLGKIQKCLWDLFEKPHTSLGARVGELSSHLLLHFNRLLLLDRCHHLDLLHCYQHRGAHAQHSPLFSGKFFPQELHICRLP